MDEGADVGKSQKSQKSMADKQQPNQVSVTKRGPGRPRKNPIIPVMGNPEESGTSVSDGNQLVTSELTDDGNVESRSEVQDVQLGPNQGDEGNLDSLERNGDEEDDLEGSLCLMDLNESLQQHQKQTRTTLPKRLEHICLPTRAQVRQQHLPKQFDYPSMGISRQVKDLTHRECEKFLVQQGVELIDEHDLLPIVLEVIKTAETISGLGASTTRELLDRPLETIYQVGSCPKIVVLLREKRFEEVEIRDLWSHGITRPERLEPEFVAEVRNELLIGTRAALNRLLKTTSVPKYQPQQPVYPFMDVAKQSHEKPVTEHFHQPVNEAPTFVNQPRFTSPSPRLDTYPESERRKPLPIPMMTEKDDPIRWLDDRKFQLRKDPCKDEVLKTALFTCALIGPLREAADKIDERQPDILWPQLIEELRENHLPSISLIAADQDGKLMKFDYSEPFSKWILKWETALRATLGEVSEKVKIFSLLRAIPVEDRLDLGQARKDKSYEDILHFMSYKDCRKRLAKESARANVDKSINAPQAKQQQLPRNNSQIGYQNQIRGNYRPQPRFGQTNTMNSGQTEVQRRPQQDIGPPKFTNLECYLCQQRGHIAANCSRRVRSLEQEEPPMDTSPQRTEDEKPPRVCSCTCSHSNVFQPEQLPENDILSENDELPDNTRIRQLNSEELINEPQSVGQAVNEMDINPCNRRPFNINVELLKSNNEVLSKRKAVVDSGADITVMDSYVAQGSPVTLYPPDSRITGVDAQSIQGLLGFVYMHVREKETGESSIVKIYIMNHLPGGLLVGENFLNAFTLTFTIRKGEKRVHIGEDMKPDPTFIFKAVTPNELGKLIEEVGASTGAFHPRAMLQFTGNGAEYNIIDLEQNYDDLQVKLLRKLPDNFQSLPQHQQLASIIHPGLDKCQRKEALDLLWEYRDVFSRADNDLGYVPPQWTDIKIELDGLPPMQKAYDVSPQKRVDFENTVQPLMRAGILEECTDPGGVPALLVKKPNGTFRLVVDYRIVNARCRKIEYPMPNIDSCLKALAGKKYFFMCDLAQGYHQLGLAPEERKKTVFVTPDRKLRYTRLPMGYVNAPYHFQKLINELLEGLQYKICIGYFDDLIAMGETWSEFLQNVQTLLDRLRQYGIKAKTDKCFMGDPVVKFLGHIVDATGIKPNPAKVADLKAMAYPKTKKEMRSMLGLFTFFSRYIPKYAILAQPLFELTAANTTFKLLDTHRAAIDALKQALVDDCMLAHFKFDLPTKLSCDASDKAVGGILMQEETLINEKTLVEEKSWRPISYYSQVLLPHQKNYTVSEKELLGILIGITKFRNYLEGKEFTVETDHHALCQLTKLKFKNGRLIDGHYSSRGSGTMLSIIVGLHICLIVFQDLASGTIESLSLPRQNLKIEFFVSALMLERPPSQTIR